MPAERLSMRKVREVLRLRHACGASERVIARSVGIGRTTVGEYLRRTAVIGTAAQVRGARAILRMKVAELAELADVSPNTIVRVEADKSVNTATLKALQAALEAQGVRFTAEGCVCPPGNS